MSVYEQMTRTIETFTNTAKEIEQITGEKAYTVRGMIDGITFIRDELTIEAASCEVY